MEGTHNFLPIVCRKNGNYSDGHAVLFKMFITKF